MATFGGCFRVSMQSVGKGVSPKLRSGSGHARKLILQQRRSTSIRRRSWILGQSFASGPIPSAANAPSQINAERISKAEKTLTLVWPRVDRYACDTLDFLWSLMLKDLVCFKKGPRLGYGPPCGRRLSTLNRHLFLPYVRTSVFDPR